MIFSSWAGWCDRAKTPRKACAPFSKNGSPIGGPSSQDSRCNITERLGSPFRIPRRLPHYQVESTGRRITVQVQVLFGNLIVNIRSRLTIRWIGDKRRVIVLD